MERGTHCLYCLYCSTQAASDKLLIFLLKMADCGPTFLNFFKMADLIIGLQELFIKKKTQGMIITVGQAWTRRLAVSV